jgi:hypothetical protein
MADKIFPKSQLPIRKTVELLPQVFQTESNEKFFGAVIDPFTQPGVLEKLTGYTGRRYGKTYNSSDIYLDTDQTLRSRYQLEPGVVINDNSGVVEDFYDYIDFKNQIKFFGNTIDRDDKITAQQHYTWNPPIDWDKYVNFREYYWEPLAPPPVRVAGNNIKIVSTYRVSLGTESSWVLTPDGVTNNPTITLYRGQTYKFKINSPGEPFVIRTNYDTGSLLFDPNITYQPNQLVVFDDKLWRAKTVVSPADGSTINENSQDWEFVEPVSLSTALDYNQGITNNKIEVGELIFQVPATAPDILFYQSAIDSNRLGRFIIADIDTNTFLDVEKEITGKVNYTSSNGIEFTNGLVIEFSGQVTPEKYKSSYWIVEGVGKSITLTNLSDLVVPTLASGAPDILFDIEGFDTEPFDDASAFPANKDYITISRDSLDRNPWSRSNRWFHRSVLEYSYKIRGTDFPADEALRAKRPIIEFKSNIQLFNHGSVAKQTVDYLENFTDDVFSKIEGSSGYNVDGEFLFEGARILVTADTDSLANNKIYRTKFIVHNGRRQIHLEEEPDSESLTGQGVLVRRGVKNSGIMYHFDGDKWIQSQRKLSVNQSPLFDAFDDNDVSFSDVEKYPVSTFTGTSIFSYRIGNGINDIELGFPIRYLNIDNIGDIQFEWVWDNQKFTFLENRTTVTLSISKGYYKINGQGFENGWSPLDPTYQQVLIDSTVITENTDTVTFESIDWNLVQDVQIKFEINGTKTELGYQRQGSIFVFDQELNTGDIVVIKILADTDPVNAYYEIPLGLEKNPLNEDLTFFTYGEATDHIGTSLEFDKEFSGNYPGNSNLRDLINFRNFGKRFLKHEDIAPLSFFLLCDKTYNVIKAIKYSGQVYLEFKNNFISKSAELPFDENIANFVDDIINDITKTKNDNSPFADSDMIGSGAFRSIDYIVEDTDIKTFALNEKFDLRSLSRKAVYVYHNNLILLHGTDYTFDDTFAFLRLKINLQENDVIQIREYVSSSYSFIPPTPTKLGLYKKYTPRKFVDDTYTTPTEIIQGHDGSITVAFGDYRDDVILELEKRIYNNLKNNYDENYFNVDELISTYYVTGDYTKNQFDDIISQDFLSYISNTGLNYTRNTYFDSENSFTYTYSNMTDRNQTTSLPGYWRGVYKWFYDTDRPHTCPWEMLGFSEKPDWWEQQYGPAPYTSGNLLLWEDLENGIIRQGSRVGTKERYKRPGLTSYIPVDKDGQLLSPLDSGLADNFTLVNNRGSFKFGDISPVEYAWRSSSSYPFAVVSALCLLRPYDYIGKNLDNSIKTKNLLGQAVNKTTNKFSLISDIMIPQVGGVLSSGLINYVNDYLKSKGIDTTEFERKIDSLDVKLSTRLSGFVDKDQQKYLLDSKSPRSTTSSIFIPAEDYDIIFNVSSPIISISYSGVIIEKTETGWSIQGYDSLQPYFNYFQAIPSQRDPLISVGGISAPFKEWDENTTFGNGEIALYRGDYYRAIKTHTSSDSFDKNLWTRIPKLPINGGVEALIRSNFKTTVSRLSYGEELNSIQEVVDFLLGYEKYLESQGFVFEEYERELQSSKNWTLSAKEFMFWTRHNWAVSSIITLSPAANRVKLVYPVGVADNLLDSFYDYQILKSDGRPLRIELINVKRDFQNIEVSTTNETQDGIYYLKLFYVLKEHVTVFNGRTVFNDVIFDKTTGYRQERIKANGFRTVDWDGDYTSPGFLFDNVNIETWQPFTDYKLGDIVSYKSFNWVSQVNQQGAEFFNDSLWTKLDSSPSKKLIPNFDYRINLFEDYFEVNSNGVGQAQRELARHFIGYQARPYLENLAEDPVSQFQIYTGFIKEKGTKNSVVKVFDKLSRIDKPSLKISEEWAIRTGKIGGYDQLTELEYKLDKQNFLLNPQPVLFVPAISNFVEDRFVRIVKDHFTVFPIETTESLYPVTSHYDTTLTAGYVSVDQVDFIFENKQDLLSVDINQFSENSHVWFTFDNFNWSVHRFNKSTILYVTAAERVSDTTVTISFNRKHGFDSNDFIGLKIENLTGFYQISNVEDFSLTIIIPEESEDPLLDISTITPVYTLTASRYASFDSVSLSDAALLPDRSKLWIDRNENSKWEVVEKKKQYLPLSLTDYGISAPLKTGSKVLYDDINKLSIASIPDSGFVMTYIETASGLSLRQILQPPGGFTDNVLGSFGQEMAISPDSKWLFVSSPAADDITSTFKGLFDSSEVYVEDDVVLYDGKLYKATGDVIGDGSSISIYSQDWELTKIIPAFSTAQGLSFAKQGFVSVYEFVNQQWTLRQSFVSPRPSDNEYFGSSMTIGVSGSEYYAAIAAPGANNNVGRVYLFVYRNNEWQILENSNYKGRYNRGSRFTASVSIINGRGILDVTSVEENTVIDVGMQVTGTGILPQTYIMEYISPTGQRGGPGQYLLNKSMTVPSTTMTGTTFYPIGSIVYYDGFLWESKADNFGDFSTITVDSNDWIQLDDISTSTSLPQNISIQDDGSTLAEGILTQSQVAELVKIGDRFGTSLTMNRDGSILVVGAPESDDQFFANYKGIYRSDYEYMEGDVVKYQNRYHKLVNDGSVPADSTIRSFNQEPGALPWQEVGDSTIETTGKVFIYERNSKDRYVLKQTITAGSLSLYSDLESGLTINSGDKFGYSLDIDNTGSVLLVASPEADLNFQNQGSVYVFNRSSDLSQEYRLVQKLESYEVFPNEYFGQSVCISPNMQKIAVGAKNSPFTAYVSYDFASTTFDSNNTRFYTSTGFAGGVYIFERKDDRYFLVEKLESNFSPFESFGHSISCSDSVVLVGSPDYIAPSPHGVVIAYEGPKTGIIRLFKKDPSKNSWDIISQQHDVIDITKIKGLAIYDEETNVKVTDLDFVDPAKMKILGIAEQELKFKTEYDPAVYNVGIDDVVVDPDLAWTEKHVGELWWDISKSKWLDYEQGDMSYRIANWGKQALGSRIVVCEWVSSPLLPSEWAALADTAEGLTNNISGQPLYPNDNVYTVKELFNPVTGQLTETRYYYWVINKNITPKIPGRKISATDVSVLISDPAAVGIVYASLIGNNDILFYNFDRIFRSGNLLFNMIYSLDDSQVNNSHREYQILAEDVVNDKPDAQLERKWIDSLVGVDEIGNRIPDPTLPEKQKYGILFRPRQSMFKDRIAILRSTIEYINMILKQEAFSDTIDFSLLMLKEEIPVEELNLYDERVNTEIDLSVVGTVRVRQAVLRANIVDGAVDTIDILDSGFGYKKTPPVIISGNGTGAEAVVSIDNQGRIIQATVTNRGKKYSSASASVRPFSVLVEFDSTQNNLWSIYSWDDIRKVFYRTRTQAFDTTKFWKYIDWWKEGYSPTSRIVKEIDGLFQEPSIVVEIGDLIKVRSYGDSGWAVLEKISQDETEIVNNYTLVGRENGTIEFTENLYNRNISGVGFDTTTSFDTGLYDIENTKELRNILNAVKQDIFVTDYEVEWNKLFFKSIRYVFVEQEYIDWVFKTSFVKAIHNVGKLEQKLNYKNDNIDSYIDYLNEVKPFRTTVRNFISSYESDEDYKSSSSDFDLPYVYSKVDGEIVRVDEFSGLINQYPWKWWADNLGFGIVSIELVDGGAGYTVPPKVLITGDGSGASATSYISNGRVSKIIVNNQGTGYKTSPTISLVGGNGNAGRNASAVAILGDSVIRSFDVTMKFDRTNKQGTYSQFSKTETFIATGSSSVFELKYPSTLDRSKITVSVNDQIILKDQYSLTVFKTYDNSYEVLKGKLNLVNVPVSGDIIVVNYEINDQILDSVNRIQKYYQPQSAMRSTDLNQLMTGIDFGGVKVQGTTFDVTGGWDALPWFTDTWDSVQASADHYVVVDGSTTAVTLPYIPADGQRINIYLKRAGEGRSRDISDLQYEQEIPEPPTIRIDDANYTDQWNSSSVINPNAQMPTFVGDGSTRIVEIGQYISLNAGDTLIFRPEDSDGSVTITDNNILDTLVSGGSLAAISGAYSTANGSTVEEILLDAGKFVSPEQVPAPEENIPGQVLDSLSIKVFSTYGSGSTPLESFTRLSDGVTAKFKINLPIVKENSILVYVDKVKKIVDIDYEIDYIDNSITLLPVPPINSVIEIISVGIGGLGILDYQNFVADGETTLFLTSAFYNDTASVFVTVNGEPSEVNFIESSELLDTKNRTLVQFALPPSAFSIIKIIVLSAVADSDSTGYSVIKINKQEFIYDGSTRSLDIDEFVNLSRGSVLASSIVEINGIALKGVDSIFRVYDGTNENILLGVDPFEASGSILPANIKVFVNGQLKILVQDYDYDGITKILTMNTTFLTIGDKIKVEVDLRAEYSFIDNNLIIAPSIPLVENDIITITWFSEYPTMDIFSDEFVGGKVNYKLATVPLDGSYVWVYKNGERLTKDVDYTVSIPRGVVYLNEQTTTQDSIKIVQFGSDVYRDPSAFELYKDMLNINYFRRYAIGSIRLNKDLFYYENEIVLTDASSLPDPKINFNKPGIITINGERIAYFQKNGNTLSQLRRGLSGSSIREVHAIGSDVNDASDTEALPYTEEQMREDYVSDGSTLLIGPLPFVPNKASITNWFRTTIPEDNGPSFELEVFVGGRRLRKTSTVLFDESLAATSPEGDRTVEAEFSVDGITPFIRLTVPPAAGVRITVIKKTGKVWYDRTDSGLSGDNLLINTNSIARTIAQKTTKLPE